MSISQYVENLTAKLDLPIVTLEVRRILRGKNSIKSLLIICVIFTVLALFTLLMVKSRTISVFDPAIAFFIVAIILYALKQAVLYLVIPIYCSKIIGTERETGALPMLAMTPMSSRSMIAQWFCIGIFPSVLITLIVSPVVILADLSKDLHLNAFLPFMQISVLSLLLLDTLNAALNAATGIWVSSMNTSSVSATVFTYVLILIVWPMIMMTPAAFIPYLIGYRGYVSAPVYLHVGLQTPITIILACLLFWFSIRRLESLRRSL